MTPNLRGVEKILHEIEYVLSHPDQNTGDIHTDLRNVLTLNFDTIATVLIAGAEERKEIIRALYDNQMEERVHRLAEVDTAIAVIKATLTDTQHALRGIMK